MSFGKAIELFLVNGTADSIITAELSNWNGMAIKIPRIEVADCDRDDIKGPGVYFLFCKEDDDTDSVYIGESETINERLIQHLRDYSADVPGIRSRYVRSARRGIRVRYFRRSNARIHRGARSDWNSAALLRLRAFRRDCLRQRSEKPCRPVRKNYAFPARLLLSGR